MCAQHALSAAGSKEGLSLNIYDENADQMHNAPPRLNRLPGVHQERPRAEHPPGTVFVFAEESDEDREALEALEKEMEARRRY